MVFKEIKLNYKVCDLHEIDKDLQEIVLRAKVQTDLSYSPYSDFSVGAAVLLEDGIMVCGNNQENIAYPSGLCAERVAMFYANSQYPKLKPQAIAIAARNKNGFLENPISPCGACRQVMLEAEMRYGKPIKVILFGTKNVLIIDSIADLLPFAFSSLN